LLSFFITTFEAKHVIIENKVTVSRFPLPKLCHCERVQRPKQSII